MNFLSLNTNFRNIISESISYADKSSDLIEENLEIHSEIESVTEKPTISPLNIFATIVENKKLTEFYHVFNSEIFKIYHSQLQIFTTDKLIQNPTLRERLCQNKESVFFQDTLSLIQLIQLDLPNEAGARRDIHEKVISLLRSLIQQKDMEKNSSQLAKEVSDFVDAICVWMYTQSNLLGPMQDLLEEITNTSFSDLNSNLDEASFLEIFFKDLRNNPKLTKSYSITEEFNDPLYSGNLPFTLYEIGSTQLIYTSRVTIDSPKEKSITISNEFKNYLASLKSEGKTHLYINLMKRLDPINENLTGNKATEGMLVKAIEGLEDDPIFGDAIMVASIDKNSDFYKQKNEFETKYNLEKNVEIFKLDFMNHLFQPVENSCFKWPKKLDLVQWQEKIPLILESVHQTYFSGKENLSQDERKIFIELSFTKIIQALHEELRPHTSNINCKHSMDRAPSAFSLLYALDKYELQGSLSQKDMANLLTMFFTPATLVRNRPITTDRFKTFLLVFKYLKNHYAKF